MGLFLILLVTGSLSEEVGTFLDEYTFQGYTGQWVRALYLPLDEPCTLWVFTRENLQGVVCGAGGEAVYDLYMELSTPEVNITDEYSDDLPVLPYSTGDQPQLTRIVVEVADMLYGAAAESVYVFSAMRQMEPEHEIMIPVEPDSAIQGE